VLLRVERAKKPFRSLPDGQGESQLLRKFPVLALRNDSGDGNPEPLIDVSSAPPILVVRIAL
jgi:hypothetical protein